MFSRNISMDFQEDSSTFPPPKGIFVYLLPYLSAIVCLFVVEARTMLTRVVKQM